MDDLKWYRAGITHAAGKTTTVYEAEGCPYSIEGRTRHIPHASGVGSWKYTSFIVMRNGYDLKEFQTLKAAKQWVESRIPAPSEYAAMRGGE